MSGLVLLLLLAAAGLAGYGLWTGWTGRRHTLRHRIASVTRTLPTQDEEEGGPLARLLEAHGLKTRLAEALWRAGLDCEPVDFVGLAVIVVLCAAGLGLVLTRSAAIAAIAGVAAALAPLALLSFRESQQRARLEAQLPDALTMLASSLRSGYSFLQALQMVAQETPPPLAREAQKVLDEVNVGLTLELALRRMVRRVRSYDVDLLVTAICIQYQVGGNLALLMDNLGETIRERFRTRGEIRALTAEGRMSGVILFLLPLGLLVFLSIANPDYMNPLYTHPVGRLLLALAAVMQVVGGWIIRRMLAVDA